MSQRKVEQKKCATVHFISISFITCAVLVSVGVCAFGFLIDRPERFCVTGMLLTITAVVVGSVGFRNLASANKESLRVWCMLLLCTSALCSISLFSKFYGNVPIFAAKIEFAAMANPLDEFIKKESEHLSKVTFSSKISDVPKKALKSIAFDAEGYCKEVDISAEDVLCYGDTVMIDSCHTGGFLATDACEQVFCGAKECRMATATVAHTEAVQRNCFVILPQTTVTKPSVAKKNQLGTALRFGDSFQIAYVPSLSQTQRYLYSQPLSHMSSSKYSRQQQVVFDGSQSQATEWTLQYADALYRLEFETMPVAFGCEVVIQHKATGSLLACNSVHYDTDFGSDFEMTCHTHVPNSRAYVLKKELNGEVCQKGELSPNRFVIRKPIASNKTEAQR